VLRFSQPPPAPHFRNVSARAFFLDRQPSFSFLPLFFCARPFPLKAYSLRFLTRRRVCRFVLHLKNIRSNFPEMPSLSERVGPFYYESILRLLPRKWFSILRSVHPQMTVFPWLLRIPRFLFYDSLSPFFKYAHISSPSAARRDRISYLIPHFSQPVSSI